MTARRTGWLVLVASAALLAGCGGQGSNVADSSGTTPAAVSSSSTVSFSTSLPEPDYPQSAAPVSPAPSSASSAAVRFVTLLGHTAGADRTKWTDALTPLCSKEFGDQLALGAPSEIPDQSVTGPAVPVGNSPLLVSAYFVPTTKGGFTVWIDYSQSPELVTAAMPGRQPFAAGQS